MHIYFETLGKYLLFTKFLTGNICLLLRRKKGTKNRKVLVPHFQDKRDFNVCQN